MSDYYSIPGYVKRVERLTREIMSTQTDPVKKTAQKTAMKAIELAPIETGILVQEIHWKKSKKGQAWVLQRNPGHKNPNWSGEPFNYAEAMRTDSPDNIAWLSKAVKRNGADPDYMKTAAQWAREVLGKNVIIHVTRIIKTTK